MSHPHHDGDFASDLHHLLSRRRVLAGAGALALAGLAGLARPRGLSAQTTATAADGTVCVAAPAETNGPFPADGTQSRDGTALNALTLAGIVRQDITTSFAGMTGTAGGLPMELTLDLVDVGAACAPLAGLAVYIWHCDAAGRYSLYEETGQNYLRGMQISDGAGRVRFTSILPGTYRGRWPHVHFEVFGSADEAVGGTRARLTGQVALPGATLRGHYLTDSRYAASLPNLDAQTLGGDMVFGDSSAAELDAQMLKVTADGPAGLGVHTQVGLAGA